MKMDRMPNYLFIFFCHPVFGLRVRINFSSLMSVVLSFIVYDRQIRNLYGIVIESLFLLPVKKVAVPVKKECNYDTLGDDAKRERRK
jgi:hypothetical protein